ncbi:hypothetical protein K8R30_03300 [archaeon]|nr:hypothetical protein [archaeon]
MNKKGNLFSEESVKVILAVTVLALMIWLMVAIFAPAFDKGDEKGESYLKQLEEAIGEADEGREAGFFMIDDGIEDLDSYMVYFGKAISFNWKKISFVSKKKSGNSIICLCAYDGNNAVCNHCTNLDLPATFFDTNAGKTHSENWTIREGVRLKLEKEGGVYEFSIR